MSRPKKKKTASKTTKSPAPSAAQRKQSGRGTPAKVTKQGRGSTKRAGPGRKKTGSTTKPARSFGPPDVVDMAPSALTLDPLNPRLNPKDRGHSEEQTAKVLLDKFAVEELARAITTGGYIDHDPIVAYRGGETVFVREGNRRLCAIKLLLDPAFAPELRQKHWLKLSEEVPAATRRKLKKLRVVVYENLDHPDLEAYIGFRHVNGTLKWPAEEKARYITDLVDRHAWTFKEIANRIGSYPKHVERHYVASRLMSQAEDNGFEGADEMSIGVCVRALQTKGIAPFLQVSFPGDPLPNETPVPDDGLENFKDFIRWTFGTDRVEPVLSDSRQLTRWGTILSSTDAVRYLRSASKPGFERAWVKAGGNKVSLADALDSAVDRLEEALPLIDRGTTDDNIRDSVLSCIRLSLRMGIQFKDLQEEYADLLKDEN